jgi:hypothetical protein
VRKKAQAGQPAASLHPVAVPPSPRGWYSCRCRQPAGPSVVVALRRAPPAAGRVRVSAVCRVPCAAAMVPGWRLNPDPGQPPRGSGWLLAACMICESNEKSADSINR